MDPRTNPRHKENPQEFWDGWGRFQEGKWYDDNPFLEGEPEHAHWLAGWCHSLMDASRPKPWWQSKTLWTAFTAAVAAMLSMMQPEMIVNNPRLSAGVAAGAAILLAGLRAVTRSPIR